MKVMGGIVAAFLGMVLYHRMEEVFTETGTTSETN
jgi:hypothetical protein